MQFAGNRSIRGAEAALLVFAADLLYALAAPRSGVAIEARAVGDFNGSEDGFCTGVYGTMCKRKSLR